jgi:hypothetical protein
LLPLFFSLFLFHHLIFSSKTTNRRYRPDRQTRYKSEDPKWVVLAEEICKYLTQFYESLGKGMGPVRVEPEPEVQEEEGAEGEGEGAGAGEEEREADSFERSMSGEEGEGCEGEEGSEGDDEMDSGEEQDDSGDEDWQEVRKKKKNDFLFFFLIRFLPRLF